jgi:putative flippase GtrA
MNSEFLQRLAKKNKLLKSLLSEKLITQFKRYLITGFSTVAIEFFLLYLFKEVFNYNLIIANSIALSIVFWFNFLMNRFWSFKSKANIKRQLVMYGFLFAFNLAASDIIIHMLSNMLQIHYLLAKVFATAAIVSWNFIIYRKVIYK